MKSITDLFKNLNPVLKQTSTLLQLVLTYPLTSNEGERSFSALKRLLTSHRSTMGSIRMDDGPLGQDGHSSWLPVSVEKQGHYRHLLFNKKS